MGFVIAAVIIGMMIWGGIEIVQAIRRWEHPISPLNAKVQAEVVNDQFNGYLAEAVIDGGEQTVGCALHAVQCTAEATACEASPSILSHVVEGAIHLLHHS